MALLVVATALALSAARAQQQPAAGDDMGPAAFLWPPGRVWSAAADNTPPCGSVTRAGKRTRFPLRECRRAAAARTARGARLSPRGVQRTAGWRSWPRTSRGTPSWASPTWPVRIRAVTGGHRAGTEREPDGEPDDEAG